MITLPGLIDVHTHLRVPGGEHKEDFGTATAAALAGGITMILGMPNTTPPLSTPDILAATAATAKQEARCDVGLFAGAAPEQLHHLPALAKTAVALKIYLNDTFGSLRVDEMPDLVTCFRNWPRHKLIAMHAEKQSVAVGIGLAATYDRPVHFCHISRAEEIDLIADAKGRGLPITCEVTPHHLFLNETDAARLGAMGDMRPLLGTQKDVDALWANINDTIDCIATDHAPHTLAEKQSNNPPPGVAGLETSLPLMLTAVSQNRLTLNRLITIMHDNPLLIYDLPEQPKTKVEVEMTPAIIRNSDMHSKCSWTPFDGMEVTARVKKVTLRGKIVFENGRVLAKKGSGQVASCNSAWRKNESLI